MHIVIYRPHDALYCETQYFGPFATFGAAYEYLCSLPALGPHCPPANAVVDTRGVKYTQELTRPTMGAAREAHGQCQG